MPRPVSERRAELLRKRRESCVKACRAIVRCGADTATKRKALDALIRYATPKGVQRPGDLRTEGVAALDASAARGAGVHHEHVVPVRVLVDRMIAGEDPRAVLDVAIVAHVLREEHRAIGPLVAKHAQLYDQMLRVDLAELPRLGRRRYTSSKLRLRRVPRLVVAPGALDG
jgi:hypothetical protein